MKKIATILVILLCIIVFSACSSINSIIGDVTDQTYNVVQSDDKYINAVKTANMNECNCTYGDAFNSFFAHNTWKHFTSDTGTEVVEFTGECMYDNQDVKAKIQFQITDKSDDYITFDATYLSFNDVSQDLLTLGVLLQKVAEEAPTDNKTRLSFNVNDSKMTNKCSDIISKRLELAGYKNNTVTPNNNKIDVILKVENVSDDFQEILSMTGDLYITGECDVVLTKEDIKKVEAIKDDNGNNVIELTFTKNGKKKFAELSEKSSYTQISLDSEVISSPSTHGRMEIDSMVIPFMNDELTEEKAKLFAAIIMSDKLPCSLTY